MSSTFFSKWLTKSFAEKGGGGRLRWEEKVANNFLEAEA
jgi:hypothetical protein